MAENVTLNNLANLQNDTTTINTINGNNATITSAFTDVLSRTGVQPNQMGAPLDMNNWPIMNLPAPGSANSPARLVDVTGSNPINISLSLQGDITAPASSGVLNTTLAKTPLTSGNVLIANGTAWNSTPITGAVSLTSGGVTALTNTGTSGHTIPFLDGNNTYSGVTTLTGGAVVNSASGLAALNVSPSAASNQALVAFQQTGTNKWFVGKQTDNSFFIFDSAASANVATSTTGSGFFIKGTTTNDNAVTGFVGEYLNNSLGLGSAIALTSGTPANVTSLAITAGDWDLWGQIYLSLAATTTLTSYQSYLTTTSAGINTSPLGGFVVMNMASVTPNTTSYGGYTVGPIRVSLASTTTYFLVVNTAFGTSTCSAYGTISARRAR